MVLVNMKPFFLGLALMLHISPISTSTTISTSSTTTGTTQSITTGTTQSITTGSTKLTTILANTTAPNATPISGPTPPAAGKTTAAPPPATTTIVPINCKSGICEGNETCINSTKILTCSISAAEQGCFRKQNDTHFEVGCRDCDTNKNTGKDWCCKGNADCIFGSMPPPSGNANMDTNVSRSFAILGTMALVLFVI